VVTRWSKTDREIISKRIFAKRQFNVIDNHWRLRDSVIVAAVVLAIAGFCAALGYWWLGPERWLLGTALALGFIVLLVFVIHDADPDDAATGAAWAFWTHRD
jgi:hypothetical protein